MLRVCWLAALSVAAACAGASAEREAARERPRAQDAVAPGSATAPASDAVPAPAAPLAITCPGASPQSGGGGDGDTSGRIDPNPIRDAVDENRPDIAACYEQHSLPDPRSGRVSIRWVIAMDGRVARAEVVQDTLEVPEIERCLLDEICTWRFPPSPRGSVTVSYPFIFDSPGL